MAHKFDIYRHTTALIHLDHLNSNFVALRSFHGKEKFFCPMVKANAYGHGDVEVARSLEKAGALRLGVGLVEEGILLRQMGVGCELLVFGIFDQRAAEEVVRWKLTPVISVWSQIAALESVRHHDMSQKIPIHLKFDTGMHRLGFEVKECRELLEKLARHPLLEVKGICTHLYKGEDIDTSQLQLEKFALVEKLFKPLKVYSHALNSAGLFNFSNTSSGARPGLSIYGLNPLKTLPPGVELKPVMSLRSHIVRYHRLLPNETVSYGATWRAQRPSVVGVVPIGYADGYHRLLSNQAKVLVKGQRVSQVGTVCMDYIMVDVTDVITDNDINNNLGLEVTLFGLDSSGTILSAQELAEKSQTIPWEILTSIGERVPRIYSFDNILGRQDAREAKV